MCAPDRFKSRLRKSEVSDFTFCDQILHRARDLFDRHVGIDAMLIKQIDVVSLEPLQRCVSDFLHVLRPAIDAELRSLSTGIEFKSELRGDHDFIAYGRKSFADKLFIRKWTIHFRRVEKCYAAVDRCTKQRDHLLLIRNPAVRGAHYPAAKPAR